MTHSFPTRRSSDLRIPSGRAMERGRDPDAIVRKVRAVRRGNLSAQVVQNVPVRIPFVEQAAERTSRACEHCLFFCGAMRSEEHTSELQSLMRISYAVFCLKKKNKHKSTSH